MGTFRIHFTSTDLARTHVAPAPDPFWEMALSLHVLQGQHSRHRFGAWRRTLPHGAAGEQFTRLIASTLVPLCPPAPYFPDFITPYEGRAGFGTGLDTVLSTPRRRIHAELQRLSPPASARSWLRAVADGGLATLRRLGRAIEAYHQHAIRPHWPTMLTQVQAEAALRHRITARDGIEGVLSSLQPIAHWRSPVLEVSGATDRDIHLDGRGLTLVPSYFGRGGAIPFADPDLPPVLVYPAAKLGALLAPAPEPGLEQLLGATRARALRAAAAGCTTTELAHRTCVSAASASDHARILRNAGLVTTQRDGKAVLHTLTPLGSALLDGR